MECAESLKAIYWVMSNYPIPIPFENWEANWIQVWVQKPITVAWHEEKIPVWSTMKATVACWMGKRQGQAGYRLTLTKAGDRIGISSMGEETMTYDNIYAAWFAIRAKVAKWAKTAISNEAIDKEMWGNKDKRNSRRI